MFDAGEKLEGKKKWVTWKKMRWLEGITGVGMNFDKLYREDDGKGTGKLWHTSMGLQKWDMTG